MKYFILSILLANFSCQSGPAVKRSPQVKQTVADTLIRPSYYDSEVDRGHALFKGLLPWVHKDGQYTYKVISDTIPGSTNDYFAVIRRVEIYKTNSGKLIQTLIPNEENGFEFFHDSSNVVGFDDVNFDGYTDIRILTWTSTNLQTKYEFWVYNPGKKKFIKNDELHALLNPCFDPIRKTIHTHWRTGFTDMGHALYHWNANKLELLAEEYEIMGIDPNQPGYYVKTEINNGKRVETEKEIWEFTVDYSHECDSCKLHKK